jgi:hypothetical protein
LQACHLLARWFAEPISSTLEMEAICSSETSVETQRTTRRHIPEDDILHKHRCENLKSYIFIYGSFNRAVSSQDYTASNNIMGLLNYELKRDWKKAFIV